MRQTITCDHCAGTFPTRGAAKGAKHGVKCTKCGHLQFVVGTLEESWASAPAPVPVRPVCIETRRPPQRKASEAPRPPRRHRWLIGLALVVGIWAAIHVNIPPPADIPEAEFQATLMAAVEQEMTMGRSAKNGAQVAIIPDDVYARAMRLDEPMLCAAAAKLSKQRVPVETVIGAPVSSCSQP